jgi:hypothetical protein
MGGRRGALKVFLERSEKKRSFGTAKRKLVDNTEMKL